MLTFESLPEISFFNGGQGLPGRHLVLEMQYSAWQKYSIAAACAILLLATLGRQVNAQDDAFGDAAADPVKLFERGQNAHAKGNFEQALEFYEQAVKVKPDFPEAEFQRGN